MYPGTWAGVSREWHCALLRRHTSANRYQIFQTEATLLVFLLFRHWFGLRCIFSTLAQIKVHLTLKVRLTSVL